jgi:hypothetical protein
LLLGVIETIGTELLQLRKVPAFDAEALIVGEMPMKDVQLYRGHPVQIALDHLDRHPVPRDVQM